MDEEYINLQEQMAELKKKNKIVYNYDEFAKALREARANKGGWFGPDKLHTAISATSPPPSWHLSPEGLEYHDERGRDFDDVLIYVAFMCGFHNGAATQEETIDNLEKYIDRSNPIEKLKASLVEASPERKDRFRELFERFKIDDEPEDNKGA